MKKTERIIRLGLCGCMLVFCLLCVTGCKKEDKINDLFPPELAAQLPETTNYNLHKFVISEELDYLQPVVRWRLNGQDLFMVVDTGSPDNYLIKNGIKKGLKGFIASEIMSNSDIRFLVEVNKLTYILDPVGTGTVGYDCEYFDGLLGLTWMTKYNNIVFDYVNKRIDYNQPPISDYDIPMVYGNYSKIYYVPFTFNGKEMLGLIDTGSYATFVNLPIIGEKKDDNGLYIVHDFCIGNVSYENMEIKAGDEVISNEGAMRTFAEDNVLGYPCFKDHVIQLDFKNNVFRIK